MDEEIKKNVSEITEAFKKGFLTIAELERLQKEERIRQLAEEARLFPPTEHTACPNCKNKVAFKKL